MFMNNHKIKLSIFLIVVLFLCSSCLPILFGGSGAGTTYSIVAGTVKDKLDKPKDKIIKAFISIIEEEKGEILSASLTDGKVRANVKGKIVYLTAKKITEKSTEITLQARLEFEVVPDSKLAQYLYKKLIERI
jgi:hypothetical protein